MRDYHPLVSVNQTINASPSRVWETVTEKTGVMFMGADVKTDWCEGHPISFEGVWDGKAFKDKGEVQTVEPQKKIAFTHFSPSSGKTDRPENYELVSIELKPSGAGTQVSLTQSRHAHASEPDSSTVAKFEENWRMMLGKLKEAAEQG